MYKYYRNIYIFLSYNSDYTFCLNPIMISLLFSTSSYLFFMRCPQCYLLILLSKLFIWYFNFWELSGFCPLIFYSKLLRHGHITLSSLTSLKDINHTNYLSLLPLVESLFPLIFFSTYLFRSFVFLTQAFFKYLMTLAYSLIL